MTVQPYRSSPVFDQDPPPAALRSRHNAKAGVWGRIRVLEGRLKLTSLDPAFEAVLDPDTPGRLSPEQPHSVDPLGPMRMRIDFYHQSPND